MFSIPFLKSAIKPFGELIFAFLAAFMLQDVLKSVTLDAIGTALVYTREFIIILVAYLVWRGLNALISKNNGLGVVLLTFFLVFAPLCALGLADDPAVFAAKLQVSAFFYWSLGGASLFGAMAIYTERTNRVSSTAAVLIIFASLALMLIGAFLQLRSADAVALMMATMLLSWGLLLLVGGRPAVMISEGTGRG